MRSKSAQGRRSFGGIGHTHGAGCIAYSSAGWNAPAEFADCGVSRGDTCLPRLRPTMARGSQSSVIGHWCLVIRHSTCWTLTAQPATVSPVGCWCSAGKRLCGRRTGNSGANPGRPRRCDRGDTDRAILMPLPRTAARRLFLPTRESEDLPAHLSQLSARDRHWAASRVRSSRSYVPQMSRRRWPRAGRC